MCGRSNWCANKANDNVVNTIPKMANNLRGRRGAVAILVAILLPMFLCFAALAIDLGYLLVVRNQLQNASDAAALAGAGWLYHGQTSPVPDWNAAQLNATAAISLNKAVNASLTGGQVQYGYFNVSPPPGTTSVLQPLPMTPGPNDMPAVKVTISKASGQNGGAVNLFFARIFGVATAPVTATAIAVISQSGNAGPSGLFPLAITGCMFSNYWDASASPPGPKIDPGTGKPFVFDIGSAYHYSACSSGQWTSFDVDRNDVPTIRNLITNGNSTGLANGDSIWIQPGTKNTIFSSVDACSAEGDKSCEYVTIPVVTNLDTHEYSPIVAFACIHIDLAVGGSGKYVQVEMSNSTKCKTPNSGGFGPSYGAVTPPRLAQ